MAVVNGEAVDFNALALGVVLLLLGWYLGYWAVRLGVRHALVDHDQRRQLLVEEEQRGSERT
jgi:hypothetical protein